MTPVLDSHSAKPSPINSWKTSFLANIQKQSKALQDLEQKFLLHSSPTLAHIKPASLFNLSFSSLEGLTELEERLDIVARKLSYLGIQFLILQKKSCCLQILVYRAHLLEKVLANQDVRKFLSCLNYTYDSYSGALEQLTKRFSSSEDEGFPHEVGIFLGYPLHDVQTFIENLEANRSAHTRQAHCKKQACCIGAWKAFSKAEKAERTFSRYRACTQYLCQAHQEGHDFIELIHCAKKAKGCPCATRTLLCVKPCLTQLSV